MMLYVKNDDRANGTEFNPETTIPDYSKPGAPLTPVWSLYVRDVDRDRGRGQNSYILDPDGFFAYPLNP